MLRIPVIRHNVESWKSSITTPLLLFFLGQKVKKKKPINKKKKKKEKESHMHPSLCGLRVWSKQFHVLETWILVMGTNCMRAPARFTSSYPVPMSPPTNDSLTSLVCFLIFSSYHQPYKQLCLAQIKRANKIWLSIVKSNYLQVLL